MYNNKSSGTGLSFLLCFPFLGWTILLCLHSKTVYAQQIMPVELLINPNEYSFALSGMIAGDIAENSLEDVSVKNTKTSGRLFLDANLNNRFFTSVHINALNNYQHNTFFDDTLDLAKLAFKHNDYKFNGSLGCRFKNKYFNYHIFADYVISSLGISDMLYGKTPVFLELNVFKINIGAQAFWKADWEQNLLVHFSLKLNKLWLENPVSSGRALENKLNLSNEERLHKQYYGCSFKTAIQLNHIAVYCETQIHFRKKTNGHDKDINYREIPGFTKRTFYAIGVATTSTAILGKKKKKEKENKQKELVSQKGVFVL